MRLQQTCHDLETRTDGMPAQIYIKKKEDSEATLISDTDDEIADAWKKLKTRLKASLQGGLVTKGNIRLDCGADLKHRYVMEAYDHCKDAGFQNVSFVAPVSGAKKD